MRSLAQPFWRQKTKKLSNKDCTTDLSTTKDQITTLSEMLHREHEEQEKKQLEESFEMASHRGFEPLLPP